MPEKTRLKAARQERGWSQNKVADMLNQRAPAHDLPQRPRASRQAELSRWENGRVTPDPATRRMFRDIYGKTNDELGFPPEATSDDLGAELADRLAKARAIDPGAITLFRRQLDSIRHADRRFGSAIRLELLTTQITELETLLRHSVLPHQRTPLAAVLTEASTLAGWLSLDSGSIEQSWSHYDRAKLAAAESTSATLTAHATAEQAYVLLEAGQVADAAELLAHARELGQRAPRLLQAWLAAAHGEILAVSTNRDAALRAFDTADALLPAETTHPELPFVFLGGHHLDRWRGHALTYLGDPAAIEHLESIVAASGASDFVRTHSAVFLDLALAHAAAGNHTAAHNYATQARRMISQLGSVRLRRRLTRLVLPISARLA